MEADDLLAQVGRQPRFSLDVSLILDASAFAEARALNDELERARLGNAGDDGDITDRPITEVAERLYEIYRDTPEVVFHLEARNAIEWEEIAKANEGDDFPLALFAASCTDPSGFDIDSVRKLKSSLTPAQWQTLVVAVRQLHEGLFDLRPTRAATAVMRGMRLSSTTALPEESDTPTS